jgi:hypothetical protein
MAFRPCIRRGANVTASGKYSASLHFACGFQRRVLWTEHDGFSRGTERCERAPEQVAVRAVRAENLAHQRATAWAAGRGERGSAVPANAQCGASEGGRRSVPTSGPSPNALWCERTQGASERNGVNLGPVLPWGELCYRWYWSHQCVTLCYLCYYTSMCL